MKKPNIKFLNMMLAAGLLFIFAGFLILVGFSSGAGFFAYSIYPVVVCFSGIVFLYIYMGISRTPFKLFVGLALVFNGMFWLIITAGMSGFLLKELWPVFVIITGISLFVAGRTKGRHFTVSYDMSSCILFSLGIIFLLFSLDVIKVSFSQIAALSAPFVLILSGVILVVLFLKRRAILDMLPEEFSDEFSGKYSEDESQDFDPSEDL